MYDDCDLADFINPKEFPVSGKNSKILHNVRFSYLQCFRVKSFVSSLYLIIYKVKKKKVPGMKAPRSMIFSLLGRTPPSLSMSSGGVVVLPMIGKLWVDVDI